MEKTIHLSPYRAMTIGSTKFVLWLLLLATLCCASVGCLPYDANPQGAFAWGEKGLDDGRFYEPRAIAIDGDDLVYVVDKVGRIQVFDLRGKFIRGWRTPEIAAGKPVGLGISHDGLLMVADTHYFRVLFYTPDGKLIEDRTIGGVNGRGNGEFGFVTDVVQDSKGNYYVGEYCGFDRVQKFDSKGQYVNQFGSSGDEPGQFLRPQSFAVDQEDRLWIADSSNHRVQVFDLKTDPATFQFQWGEFGSEPGQLNRPFGIELDADNNVILTEYGNHRVSKFRPDGTFMGIFGSHGSAPGQFSEPWAISRDSEGAFVVTDRRNHRVQRFFFPKTTSEDQARLRKSTSERTVAALKETHDE
ncbi:MAG: 6-bladed beta-propeller [Planctomycetota bacterium]